ncbi:MAG: NAD(P)H-hydrate epimerase, partial [Chitinophagaceae bacterium]
MQIYSAAQIHEWDDFTIKNEPVSSVDLMERAAAACYTWLSKNGYDNRAFSVYCGKGNNGGDGLALARMLALSGHDVEVCIAEFGHKGTSDFQANLERLHNTTAIIRFVSEQGQLRQVPDNHLVIDAIFGSGLNRRPEGLNQQMIAHLNKSQATIISIDVPSGMSADQSSAGHTIINATHTLSFQQHKLAFLVPENEAYCGSIHILDIGLHKSFIKQTQSIAWLTDASMAAGYYRPRKNFGHKGTYGHSLIVAGSRGKIGAAVLA